MEPLFREGNENDHFDCSLLSQNATGGAMTPIPMSLPLS